MKKVLSLTTYIKNLHIAVTLATLASIAARTVGERTFSLHGLGHISDQDGTASTGFSTLALAFLGASTVSPLGAVPVEGGGHDV